MAETRREIKEGADARASAVAKGLADRQAELDKQDEAEARAKGHFLQEVEGSTDNMKEDLEEEKDRSRMGHDCKEKGSYDSRGSI